MSNGSRLVALLGLLIAPSALAQPVDPPPQPAPTPPLAPPGPPPAPITAAPPAPTAAATPAPTPLVAPTAPSAYSVDNGAPPPAAPHKPEPVVKSKWAATLYGFVEADAIYDSTQGLSDSAGNGAVARPKTYAGDHGQTTFGARNTRLGFKLTAPEYHSVKSTGVIEADFLGNQPTTATEAQFWQNPGFRIRHAYVKIEDPGVDLLVGQTWDLFGWSSAFHPNTVEIQGVPGQVYGRAPQIRLSKTFTSDAIDVDIAVAAVRPPERDSAIPDGQAGVKLSIPKLHAWHTAGAASSALDPAALGVSVIGRRFGVNPFPGMPNQDSQVNANGYGLSVDLLLPIIPASKDRHSNALTLTASFVDGAGIADQYTGLSGGVGEPTPAGTATYTPNVDNGLVLYHHDADGTYSLHPVQWTSEIIGLQYYLPAPLFLSVNYSHMNSDNAQLYGAPTKVFTSSSWADANLFWDVTPAVRLGAEYAMFQQHYADGVDATNYRFQFSAFYIF